ncbi:MAG: DNA gyrase inhibitor YacG [Pseudomonadota bacterium]
MTCPICSKPTVAAYRPFCSRRCADIDLGKWLTGSYAIPTEESEDDAAERPRAEPGEGG